jgi:hypothetical protein
VLFVKNSSKAQISRAIIKASGKQAKNGPAGRVESSSWAVGLLAQSAHVSGAVGAGPRHGLDSQSPSWAAELAHGGRHHGAEKSLLHSNALAVCPARCPARRSGAVTHHKVTGDAPTTAVRTKCSPCHKFYLPLPTRQRLRLPCTGNYRTMFFFLNGWAHTLRCVCSKFITLAAVNGPCTTTHSLGGLQIPCWLGSDPPMGWGLGLAPATQEFWVRFPNERNQGKQGATLC